MRRGKYNNRPTCGFDSKREHARSIELGLLERAGKIRALKRQVKFEVIPKQDGERAANYFADFTYYDQEGNFIVEDVKGVKTPEYILKRKLMLLFHGIRIKETK